MSPGYRISVIVPTYNRADLICEALDSVLAQTYPAHEVIVVDDGSTDQTAATVERRYGGRVRYITRENGGEGAARNTGTRAAVGDWVAFLDSDDMWFPQKLEWQVGALDRFPNADVCYCGDGQEMPREYPCGPARVVPPPARAALYRALLDRSLVGISTVVIRRDVLRAVGAFDTELRWGVDWEFLARLALAADFVKVDHALVYYRKHAGNITGDIDLRVSNGVRALRKIYAAPEAARFRGRLRGRISEVTADAGVELFYAGRHAAARRLLCRALYASPANILAWSYLAKTLLPADWLRRARDARYGVSRSA